MILAAAEKLFAARGYEGTSLAQIGAAAGLSRAAPAYFFGSKDALYAATLQRVFAAREAVLRPAAQPLAAWAGQGGREGLAEALDAAAGGYLAFLAARPEFLSLIEREALAGGRRLASAPHASTAIEDALTALRALAPAHGLREFDVAEALTAFIALCFFPLAHRDTFLARHGRDPDDPAFLTARRAQVVDVMLHLLLEDAP